MLFTLSTLIVLKYEYLRLCCFCPLTSVIIHVLMLHPVKAVGAET